MERFDISIQQGNQQLGFEVREYMHHGGDHCMFEIFTDDKMVVSFNPDPYESLTVCKNPGSLNNKLVHLIADKLEKFI
ncbi:hypothetical protein [Mucilaginibacter glaciei]|uniref:Uncharacterized protein n=1 Tax=Mucilaginibacter glaciei TaxID=2772109 RepID=A0A926NQ17_9SPHI|nr:hypothetical protein [Mucilaginibacter glaciei]MBD1393288.1 hypothetical protein [Mucilaginibacter glaciei]